MRQSLFNLTGLSALATGSSQGWGFAIAQGLGEAGATVFLNGRNEAKLDRAVSRFRDPGITVHGVRMDVRDEEDIAKVIPEVEKNIGPINILVNNAGIQKRGNLEEIDKDTWQDVINTNLTTGG